MYVLERILHLFLIPFVLLVVLVVRPTSVYAASAIKVGSTPYFSVLVGSDLYVANTASNTVSVIDTTTNRVIDTISVGTSPRSPIVVGTDVYVNNYASDDVSIIDTTTNTVTATISVGDFPYALAVANEKVYVTNTFSNNVSVIDTATNTVVATIPVGNGPRYPMVVGTDVYVSNYSSNSVSVISSLTDTVTNTIAVGTGPYLGTLVGSSFYVSNIGGNTVSVINTTTKAVSATITVGSGPGGSLLAGTKLYVNNTSGASVSVINTLTNTVSSTISVGLTPYDFTKVDSFIYVGNYNSGTISVINTATDVVDATITVGINPHSSTAVGTRLYNNNVSSGSVSVINTLTNTIIPVEAVPSEAQIIGKSISIVFNYTLDTTNIPSVDDFTVYVNNIEHSIEDISVDTNTVFLTLFSPTASSDTVTVSYTQGSIPLKDADDIAVQSFSEYPVTNNGFVATTEVSEITQTTATFSGEILGSIGDAATIRGFKYGETTLLKNTISEEGEFWAETYSLSAEDLRCGGRYYIRAFATNPAGTSYGAQQIFSASSCGNRTGFLLEKKEKVSSADSVSNSTQPFVFKTQLRFGFRHPDVKELQKFLNTHGIPVAFEGDGAQGKETDFFGIKTKAALIQFQEAHADTILRPLGLSKGTGIFGPKTIEFINSL